MKYTAAALIISGLASSAFAAPNANLESRTGTNPSCKFGTYRCTSPNTGIEICNVLNKWELVGPCPSGTSCTNLPQNGFTLPFCTNNPAPTPAATKEKRNGRPGTSPGEHCSTPGQYSCFGPYAIQVCDTQNVSQFVGSCPERSHCDYLNGIAYCVASV
ncbi:hypothetical protein QBC43DRAFT_309939 [Cladorrhinum sp. PSN259]|nr:hypothetical protein QBC43DRAFT_309939 [Cladorrhinum sp. PSN259]